MGAYSSSLAVDLRKAWGELEAIPAPGTHGFEPALTIAQI